MFKEFKEFALRGNVIDLATGVIVGTAFNKIVTSLTQDVLMPPIGLLLGRVNFSSLFISLNGQEYASLEAAKAAGAPTINYGLFLNNVLDFVIVAFVVFLLVKQINRLRRKEEPKVAAHTTRECPYCIAKVPLKAIRCPHCTSTLEAI